MILNQKLVVFQLEGDVTLRRVRKKQLSSGEATVIFEKREMSEALFIGQKSVGSVEAINFCVNYQVQDTGDDTPYGLYLTRGESEHRHGAVHGFVVASVGGGRFIVVSVADEVVGRRIPYQT